MALALALDFCESEFEPTYKTFDLDPILFLANIDRILINPTVPSWVWTNFGGLILILIL